MQRTIKSRQQAAAVAQTWTKGTENESCDDVTLRALSNLLPEEMTVELKKSQADEANAYLVHLAEVLLEIKIPSAEEHYERWKEGIWKDVPFVDCSSWKSRLPAVRALLQHAYRTARNAEQMLSIASVERKIEEMLNLS
jgi:hypothetical protein